MFIICTFYLCIYFIVFECDICSFLIANLGYVKMGKINLHDFGAAVRERNTFTNSAVH